MTLNYDTLLTTEKMQKALFEENTDIKEEEAAVLLFSLSIAARRKDTPSFPPRRRVTVVEESTKSSDESGQDDSDYDEGKQKEEEDNVRVVTPQMWAKYDFQERVRHLKEFKRRFGHCKVPQLYKENPSMGLWVRDMRVKKRKGKLSEKVFLVVLFC